MRAFLMVITIMVAFFMVTGCEDTVTKDEFFKLVDPKKNAKMISDSHPEIYYCFNLTRIKKLSVEILRRRTTVALNT